MDGVCVIKHIRNKTIMKAEISHQINDIIFQCFYKKIDTQGIDYFLSNCDTYIMFQNMKIIALVQVEYETSRRFWLQHVCTHPTYRRRGYMKLLLSYVLLDIKIRYPKLKEVRLEVEKDLKGAQKLYKLIGFQLKKWTHHRTAIMYYKWKLGSHL